MKEKTKKNRIKTKLFSMALALALIVGCVPFTNITVFAFEKSSLPSDKSHDHCMAPTADHFYFTGETWESGGAVYVCGKKISADNRGTVYSRNSSPSMKMDLFPQNAQAGWYYLDDTLWKSCQHNHEWEYTASGATLTAECKAGYCYLNDGTGAHKVSLTLTASSQNYSGNPVQATLADVDAWKAAIDSVPDIMYSGRGNTTYAKSVNAPKEIGTYTASISAGDPAVTASVDFEITKPLSQIKEEAKAEIDKAVGTDTTDNVKKATDAAKAAIEAATTPEEVEKAKADGIAAIQAAIKANAEAAYKKDDKKETSYKTSSKKATVTVPKTQEKNGVKYTVTSIKKDAFNGKYVKTVKLPSTIKKINSKAFYGDNKLRSLKITSKKISVSKTAFKGIKKANLKKIQVTVSKKMSKKNFNALKKNLVKQGLKSKNIVRK